MNIVKGCVTMHLWLKQIDVMEVIIDYLSSKTGVPNKTGDENL